MVFGCVWMCLGEKLEREERESTQKLPKIFLFLQNEGSRGIYTGKMTNRLPPHQSVVFSFSWSSFWMHI